MNLRSTAALALVLPLLAVLPATLVPATAAPADVPHPAAPPGGCAVTQDVTKNRSSASVTSVRRTKATRLALRTRRTDDGWRAYLSVRSTWRTSATATLTHAYASADCDVAEREVTATRTRTGSPTVTESARRVRATRAEAVRAARAAVRTRSERAARRHTRTRAEDAAFLAARTSFLTSLPTRDAATPDIHRSMPTAKQACPTRLQKTPASQFAITQQRGATVPQFSDAAQIWVCRYSPVDGTVESRRKVTAPARARILASLRSLTTLDPRIAIACTADIGPTYLVTHVARDGVRTGAVYSTSGCDDVKLTPDPKRVAAGTTTSPGVPSGAYVPRLSMLAALVSVS